MVEPLLTAADVADILKVDESTVGKFARKGHLKAVILSMPGARRKTLRFTLAEVRRFIAEGEGAARKSTGVDEPRRRVGRSRGQRDTSGGL